MQILVQVVCTPGPSLRDAIARDPRLGRHHLVVTQRKRPGRSRGWAKMHSTAGRHGAINLEWDSDTSVLVSRVVTRARGKPNDIIGDFVGFLLRRYPRRIQAINIIPRS